MKRLKELIEKRGYVVSDSRSMGARERALQQARSMLEKLDKMELESDLESATTTQNWWSPNAREGKRRVAIRYSGMVVPDTGIFVDNTLEAVRTSIEDFRDAIEETEDSEWQAEEQRREELKEKNKASRKKN